MFETNQLLPLVFVKSGIMKVKVSVITEVEGELIV